MRTELPISDGFYEDASKPISAQECVNWIPVVPQTNALSRAQLIGTPGLVQFATTGTSIARGEHTMKSIAYTVNGNNLYRTNANGTTDNLGTITGSGKVSMADNGLQLCIVVPGSLGYVFTDNPDTLTQITDSDFTSSLGPSQQVVLKDGYFIHYNNNSAASNFPIFFISNLNDGLTYDALDFGTAEVDPDEITGLHVNRNRLYVGGNVTMEPFQNVGGTGFPFQRIPGGVIQKGVRAKFTLLEFDNSFLYLGGGLNEQAAIWRFTGSSAQKISTPAIDNVIQDSTDAELSDMFATTYGEDGEYFANFHFRNRVLTYCASASALKGKPVWFERKSKDTFGQDTTWRVGGIIDAYGETLVTDLVDGRIGKIDKDTYTEYGTNINRVVASAPYHAQGERLNIGEIELTCESGVGNTDEPDPVIRKSFSDDGFIFTSEAPRALGKEGEYKKRQVWKRQGQAPRFRVERFSMSDPVKAVIIKLEAELEVNV
jgi:hypothetical protein